MNFIDGEIVANGGAPEFRATNLETALADSLDVGNAGRRAVLGVRAEHVLPSIRTPRRDAGTVTLIEPLGDATLVFFDHGGATDWSPRSTPIWRLSPGDRSISSSTRPTAICSRRRRNRLN